MSENAYTILCDGLFALQASIEGTRVLGAGHAAVEAKALAAATLLTRASDALRLRRDARGNLTVVCFDGRVACGTTPLPSASPLAASLFASLSQLAGPALVIASNVEQSDVVALAASIISRGAAELPAGNALQARPLESAAQHALAQSQAKQIPKIDTALASPALNTAWDNIRQGKAIPMHAVDSLADQMSAMLQGDASALVHLSKLKTHDQYTFVHTINVSILSASLAQACGLSDSKVRDIAVGAMLHDVGKGVVPEHILNKKGKLENDELQVMRRHPLDGARMLIDSGNAPDLAIVIAYEHHMHLNRTGYPLPRQDHFPHLASQIVQVADMFDALRTNRPYRAGMPLAQAQEIMMQGAGVTHDKALLDWFFARIASRCAEEPASNQAGTQAMNQAAHAPLAGAPPRTLIVP